MILTPSNQNNMPADDNVVQTFQIEEISGQSEDKSAPLRGRMVRAGSVLDDILDGHDYPEAVAHLVAETVTLALMLSSMLKYEGIFSLQIKGDGPISMLLSDVTSEGVVRGCAAFDAEALQAAEAGRNSAEVVEGSENRLAEYVGQGYIVFTVYKAGKDVGYQGIVDLKGESLADCVQHYFTQSEQIGAAIKMAVGRRDKQWRAGGIMLQNMPEDEVNLNAGVSNLSEDEWRHAMILMNTCSDDEFLDPALHSYVLLKRLFNEEEVRVFTPQSIKKGCRCSREKTQSMLVLMEEDDFQYIIKDGKIAMTCEFCGEKYQFDPEEITALKKEN